MKAYLTPAGKTAIIVDGFLDRAKEEFGFDLAILLTDNAYTAKLYEKFADENVYIVPIYNPLYGLMDYKPAVQRLLRQTLLFCPDPELIIVNSSGGTEKMTNIIKDAGDILSLKYPVARVFGVYDVVSKDVIFTKKPVLEQEEELAAIEEELAFMRKLKEEMDDNSCLDINEE